jgi:unsaturated rhamnogalacturonyl hydrolase
MYLATGEEKYIDELVLQLSTHREKLQVPEWGLWVHGWDKADWGHCLFCSQVHWSKNKDHRSAEMWGRGNGWVIVTLSDALKALPKNHPQYQKLSGFLAEMIARLPELQDKKTGHWYQLPVRNNDPDNFIESSCTAMFGYGITTALELRIANTDDFKNSAQLAYDGLRQHSITPVNGTHLTTQNICSATCIGDKQYYFKRKVQKGKAYGLASFIKFGLTYEWYKGWRKQ